MGRRLTLGLAKGLVIGILLGAGFQYGLRWSRTPELLGFLLAMGGAGTAGVFAGRPPWQEGAWIESALKGVGGVAVGALTYWGFTYLTWPVPWPGLTAPQTAATLPALYVPVAAAVYGALVELDNTDGPPGRERKRKGKERILTDDFELDGEPLSRRKNRKIAEKA